MSSPECPSFQTLRLQLDDHVASVTLDNPERANAMVAEMWDELQRCFEWLDAEPSVRVVVLAAAGKHFCSGVDLALLAQLLPRDDDRHRASEQLRLLIKRLQHNLGAIERCRKPVLAAIHGACIGGGVDLICCADMRYASRDAFFAIKEIDLAITADVGTLQRLPHLIGRGHANELALTGRRCDATEAARLGLVNRVCETHGELMTEVHAQAARIAAKSPLAVRGTKEMLLYGRDHSVADGLNYVATWNSAMLHPEEIARAASAQGKTPDFDP